MNITLEAGLAQALARLLIPFGFAFVISALCAPILIPLLRRLKFGQSIREIGPSWHQKKAGTPTMGGLIFILGVTVATLLCVRDTAVTGVLLCALAYGAIGFIDDFIKVVLKRNLGLTALQKLLLQIAAAVAFVVVLWRMGILQTDILIPFTDVSWEMGWLFIPFAVFIIVGYTNAVNLTDGLDGLATSVTFVVSLFFTAGAFLYGNIQLAAFCIALTGGCLAFLLYNHYPAKVFMGDTGSLFLGGGITAAAILLKMPLILVIAGIIYGAEALSVMLQVLYFKLTGKRIFKMSPIHHHFEMSGWNEVKIVIVFCVVSLIACVISLLAIWPGLPGVVTGW